MAVDDTYTKALLHMDGADTSTTFTDESGKTWTARVTAQIDTDQSVFGGASGLLDGNSDWIDTPDHADFYFSADFTIDFRVRFNALPGVGAGQMLYAQYQGANDRTLLYLQNTAGTYAWKFLVQSTGGGNLISFSEDVAISATTWYHIAFTRDGNDYRCFQAGTQVGGTLNDASAIPNYTGVIKIGAQNSDNYLNGWVDEYRVSNGIARWTANFTPPSMAYGSAGNFFNLF